MCLDMPTNTLIYGHKMSAGISLLGNHDFRGCLFSVASFESSLCFITENVLLGKSRFPDKCGFFRWPSRCRGHRDFDHSILYTPYILDYQKETADNSFANILTGLSGGCRGSTSRDATNCLPSRFSLSETRRRYGWLRMVFPGARLFRAPI